MPSLRVKGQDVEISVLVGSIQQVALTDVRSFEAAFQLEIKTEGYLGETTDRRDDIFHGVRMRMELHFESQDVFAFIQSLLDRSQRRSPNTTINVKATLNMPNGETPRMVFKDLAFGEIPMNFASRGDFGAITLDAECSQASVITA